MGNYIHNSVYADNAPGLITRDSRGITIESGLRVAYNQGGNIVIGTILELKKSSWKKVRQGYWRLEFELKIVNESGETSTVKNPNSFVII